MARPWNIVEDAIKGTLVQMADATKNNIVVTAAANLPQAPAGQYAVGARIEKPAGTVISTGHYQANTGIHAEIDALNNTPHGWLWSPACDNAILLSSDNPCKRCAAILSPLRRVHQWTVRALSRSFHTTYAGAYNLPDGILQQMINALVHHNAISQEEGVRFRAQIKNLINGWS